MRHFPSIFKILPLLLLFSSVSIHARERINTQHSTLSGIRHFGKQLYMTGLWHDGGRKTSFFLSKELDGDKSVWWDTGLLLWGSHVGFRKMLPVAWFDQDWFGGAYVGFDVMNDWLSDMGSFNLKPFGVYPVRLNVGFEASAGQWGYATLNFYGDFDNSSNGYGAKDYFGISSKISFNNLPISAFPKVRPFIGGACSKVGLALNNFTPEWLPSFIVGAKWLINNWLDFELKYIYDHKGLQSPINFGFQIRFDEINPNINYFKYRYRRPPDSYIPHYANSSFLPVKLHANTQNSEEDVEEIIREDLSKDDLSMWQLAITGDQQKLAIRRNQTNNGDAQEVILDDGTVARVSNQPFTPEDFKRADKIIFKQGLDDLSIIKYNSIQVVDGNTKISVTGGASEEDLRWVLERQDVAPKSILTMHNPDGNQVGIGYAGSGASFLVGLRMMGGQIIQAVQNSFRENFAMVEASKPTAGGGSQTILLVCSPTGMRAEEKAVRAGYLRPLPDAHNSLQNSLLGYNSPSTIAGSSNNRIAYQSGAVQSSGRSVRSVGSTRSTRSAGRIGR